MKIPATASYVLVYSITEHQYLGAMLEAYVVQLTSAGNLSLVHQRIHSGNADYYDKKLDENDYEALKLLDECTPEYLVKRFSKVKKIRPSVFFDKYFDKTLFQRQIRPHLEQRLAKVLQLIKGKQLYRKKLKNVVYEPVEWCKDPATVLFHLRRNDTNTHYFATIKHNNHRVHFAQNHSILLSKKPCYLVAGGRLLFFDEHFDGTKIAPFVNKRFIEIPKATEHDYFKKFVVPLIEENNVYAVGLEIVTEKHVATPKITLGRLLDGGYGAGLGFVYGDHTFPYHSSKYVSVHLKKEADSYTFVRVKRSRQWEEIKKQTLEMYGLVHQQGSEFGFDREATLEQLIQWVMDNKEDLDKAGFIVDQKLDNDYSLETPDIEFVATESGDWFDVKAKIKLGGFDLPVQVLRKAIDRGDTTVVLPNGKTALIPEKWIEQLKGLSIFSETENELRLRKQHIGLVKPYLNLTDKVNGLQNVAGFEGVVEQQSPKGFKGELRPYQKAGYDWLCFLYDVGLGGCLADDMGLGKTVQSLAFLQYVREKASQENQAVEQVDLFSTSARATSLLVVPTSLIYNWMHEGRKFSPELNFIPHVGLNRAKDVSRFRSADVVVTTYGTLRNDIELFEQFPFEVVLLDESQFIKNPTSQVAKKVNRLQAKLRVTLTGTPIENSVSDLWSQMNFVNPGLLGNYKFFQKEFAVPIEKQMDEAVSDRLQRIIKPFVMRRTKMQVATDLPPKIEQVVYCNMTEEQQDIYEKTKSTYRNLIWDSIQKNGMAKSRIQLLSGLTKLRQIANHPVLGDEEYQASSGKFQQIEQMLLTALEENHNLLIFSQFVGHLSLVQKLLQERDIEYCYLDGGTKVDERKKQVDRFQNGECSVFLISLKAGGFGLNLTAADYVFMLDPWWNPAAEDQAIDRTHRIGQTKTVFSYKFVTSNTVEDKIITLQNKKKKLSASLIKTEESYIKQVTVEDIKHIFE
ncbi:MAG: DEAD/DEAH box helicase [Bacteroidia bacterium]|nr:DEAD/DEAH box helicase [Bacteroidia bacterium]